MVSNLLIYHDYIKVPHDFNARSAQPSNELLTTYCMHHKINIEDDRERERQRKKEMEI